MSTFRGGSGNTSQWCGGGGVMHRSPHGDMDTTPSLCARKVARSQPPKHPIAASGGQPWQAVWHSPATRGPGGGSKAAAGLRLTRLLGNVMLSADCPAKDMSQIVEPVIEQLTTLPRTEVLLKPEIDAEVTTGLNWAKMRTPVDNAATLGFIGRSIEWIAAKDPPGQHLHKAQRIPWPRPGFGVAGERRN